MLNFTDLTHAGIANGAQLFNGHALSGSAASKMPRRFGDASSIGATRIAAILALADDAKAGPLWRGRRGLRSRPENAPRHLQEQTRTPRQKVARTAAETNRRWDQ